MPIRLIGKKSPYTGNLLFEILNNLRNYGVGRVVLRNSYKIYPEMSFYVIRKVKPMRETIGPGPDELVYGNVWVDEVYRGRKLGLRYLQNDTYLPDFHLIPREEEDKYLQYEAKEVIKYLPKYSPVPPVLKELIKRKNPSLKEEPKMKVVYLDLSEHLIYKIAEDEGKEPDYELPIKIPEKFRVGIKT